MNKNVTQMSQVTSDNKPHNRHVAGDNGTCSQQVRNDGGPHSTQINRI